MKKILLLVVLAVLLNVGSVLSQDYGIQLIGGPEFETDTVDLDDLRIGEEVEIDGWGILTLKSFDFIDYFYRLPLPDAFWRYSESIDSGTDADFAFLRMDIVNTTMSSRNYLKDYSVKVIYDNTYEFSGWANQYDYNQSSDKVINSDINFAIKSMYDGHYVFGCTLPNRVITDSKPLRMEITIDGNEMTYHIRK